MNSKLLAYAMDFASFLIQKMGQRDNIKTIILFGSAAREEAEKTSDVDIFIDVVKDDKRTGEECLTIAQDFYASAKYKNYWKTLGIENQIRLTIGKLDSWKNLKPSIIANGITLLGKYKTDLKERQHKTYFIWENLKPNSKRVLFNKQLLGYKQYKKFYPGLLQKYNGERLGKGCITVPLEHSVVFLKLFRKYKVAVKIKKIIEYF